MDSAYDGTIIQAKNAIKEHFRNILKVDTCTSNFTTMHLNRIFHRKIVLTFFYSEWNVRCGVRTKPKNTLRVDRVLY